MLRHLFGCVCGKYRWAAHDFDMAILSASRVAVVIWWVLWFSRFSFVSFVLFSSCTSVVSTRSTNWGFGKTAKMNLDCTRFHTLSDVTSAPVFFFNNSTMYIGEHEQDPATAIMQAPGDCRTADRDADKECERSGTGES